MNNRIKRISPDKWYGNRIFQKDFYEAMENVQKEYETTPKGDRKDKFGLMICIPTGGGKTRLMVTYAINKFLYVPKPRKVLWLAQSNELLEQARETFFELLSDEDLQVSDELDWENAFCDAEYYGGKNNPICQNTSIVFASFQTLNSANGSKEEVKNWLKSDSIIIESDSIIIVDEAHHAPANTYLSIIKEFTQDFSTLLFGLSATPLRTQMEKNNALLELFPTKLIDSKGKYVHISLEELITTGHLVPRNTEDVIYNLSEEEIHAYEETQNPNRYQALGDVLGNSDEFNQLVANHYLKDRVKYGKTVIFTASRNQADRLKKEIDRLKPKDVETYLVDADNKNDLINFKPKKDFNTGEMMWETSDHKVMVNIKVLGEGVDIRDIHTVFLAKPSKSPIDVTQMVGRALRSVPVNEGEKGYKKEAYVVNFAVKGLENKLVIQDPRLTMDLYELECGLRADTLENRDKGKHKQEISNLLQEEAAADIKMPFISFIMIGYYEIFPDGDEGPSIIQIVTMEEYEKIENYLKGNGPFPKRRLHFHSGRRYSDQKALFEKAKNEESAVFHSFYNELDALYELKKLLREKLDECFSPDELRSWSDKLYQNIKEDEQTKQKWNIFVEDRKIGNPEEFWKSIRSELLGIELEKYIAGGKKYGKS